MQILNQKHNNNNKKIKKSQILLIGSLLVFIGLMTMSWNSFIKLREEVYSDLKIEIMSLDTSDGSTIVPVANNLPTNNSVNKNNTNTQNQSNNQPSINYDKYLGVLEIPKISLKRGFYGLDNKYNDIQYNVTLVRGSALPDVARGNLILMAHSGDAYISFFAYLYMLNVGDKAYVTYNHKKYTYQVVNIYEVPKIGQVTINRNYNKTTMTLITCTKNNDYTQTIYILEQI